jgi:rubrerythrin
MISRRSFLTGSLIFAATVPVSAFEQSQDKNSSKKESKPKDPLNPNGEEKSSHERTFTDKEGNQYRICPQCGYNMYKEGRVWLCANCGYSYVE